MKRLVLIGFEESQIITSELLKKGIETYSCDILPTSGQNPENHLQMDFFKALHIKEWTDIILHPPCTYTAICGNRWYFDKEERKQGIELCKNAWFESIKKCERVMLEQPKTIMQKYIGPKSQIIHP